MASDQQLLAELEALVAGDTGMFIETDLSLILPIGAQGYALDSSGKVVGVKLGYGEYDSPTVANIICRFSNLRRLVFVPHAACDIPSAIGNLKHLTFCYLGGAVRRLPPEILSLNLHIRYGDFALIRSEIAGFSNETSDILKRLAEGILTESGNGRTLSELTEERQILFDQRKAEVKAERSVLASVTEAFRSAVFKHEGIFLDPNELEDPPVEIAAKGHEAIATYFRERVAGALPLNELKVLLVGNGSAGKTSLVKQVLGEAFDAKESQTHGINIRTWNVRIDEAKDVKLNFWDFGGQEIMHATHQFFLSKRSMYILVLDGRKEEDPEYWLQHVESFGGDSPILVVLNKIDEHPAFEVNRLHLKGKYKGIIDFFRVSCATGAGIHDFTERLTTELAKVPMLQTLWPNDWFHVKRRLENMGTAYISLSEYRSICMEEKVTGEKNQELLVDFLNDLGVVLHFKDMELLDTHVLDPRWVTEAVYRIINSELLAKQKGILRMPQLGEALKPRDAESCVYPVDKHRYIVDLMLKFELCYRLDNNAILVPDLLDVQQPPIIFQHRDQLKFVFEYTYLPKSIMPRFIVRMHKDIKDGVRWRTGVLLEDKAFNATALVLADEKEKRIYVQVAGGQKRDYFAVIRKVIKDLNSSFEKLTVTELVPLPDAPSITVDYLDLLGHEANLREEIFIGRLGRAYDVESLLNGIEKSERQRDRHAQLVYNIKGDYFEKANAETISRIDAQQIQKVGIGGRMNHKPRSWEKVLVYLTAFLFLGVVSFLAIRNQPIADPNFVVMLRIILSLAVAVFGATIPGMLRVDFSAKGMAIRATGALALFVITYLLTPKVL